MQCPAQTSATLRRHTNPASAHGPRWRRRVPSGRWLPAPPLVAGAPARWAEDPPGGLWDHPQDLTPATALWVLGVPLAPPVHNILPTTATNRPGIRGPSISGRQDHRLGRRASE